MRCAMAYKHLNCEERYYIEVERRRGLSANKIAKSLNRSQSCVSRELQRNTGEKGYRSKQANNKAQDRHANKPKKVKLTSEIKSIINDRLNDDWSPEQIAGRLKTEGVINISHETIYQYVLKDKKAGGNLYMKLRHQGKTYKKRYGSPQREAIPDRVDIDERPEAANNRERVGDWEADTIIGQKHQGAIVTVDERVTKLRLAAPIGRKLASTTTEAVSNLLEPLKDFVLSITYDNGKEFCGHIEISENLECDGYFAKPYSSWERGQNENANGLLRQYFPKAMNLLDATVKEVFVAVDKLNSRPRKCLGYKTAYEMFEELTNIDVRNLFGYALMT
jgi:transposase, IS30 family